MLARAFSRSLFIFSLSISVPLFAQPVMPTISGETTDGNEVVLPQLGTERYTIVALAYGKKASPLLEEWYAPAYTRFVAKHGLFAGSYDVDLWFVPMFVGADKLAYGPSMKRLRKEVDPEVAARVLFFKGDASAVIQALALDNKDIPYFIVLDPEGRIIHRAQGAFDLSKLDEMEASMIP